jgi:hypothetical protein
MDYTRYRLRSVRELDKFANDTDFIVMRNKVYEFLMTMKPGERRAVEKFVREENRERFVQLCHQFILEGNYFFGYEFSNYYDVIIRREVEPRRRQQEVASE